MERKKVALGMGGMAVVVAVVVAALRAPPARPAPQGAGTPVAAQDNMIPQRSTGSPNAPVVIYELSDFQCPYCRSFWEETLPVLDKEYISTGKVRMVFLNYPLVQLHPNAPAAHTFAMCAAAQNRFWPVHNLLFKYQARWKDQADPAAAFGALADSAALDRRALDACLAARPHEWLVQGETKDAMNAGIGGTPAFVINGGILAGAQPIEVWRPILDSIYRTAIATRN